MIRFLPDTWRDALLRPLAMAAPDAGVYVEIMAPDIRFAVIAALMVLCGAFAWRAKWRLTPVVALLLFVLCSFVIWLLTSGNGRYFIPVLLVAGPLCVALIHRLPFTRNLRLLMAVAVLGLQAFVLFENSPWRWWGLVQWSDKPFFEVALDAQASTVPATYVTVTSISYSLVAPRFPETSRWVNISSQPDADKDPDGRRLQAVLAASESLQLLIPTAPDDVQAGGQPSEAISRMINAMLAKQKLALKEPQQCRLLQSKGLANRAFGSLDDVRLEMLAKMGFWVCPLRYPVPRAIGATHEGNSQINRALDAVEKMCPRFFPPGQALTGRMEGGFVRGYSAADMKLYVFEDQKVFYRYWRALNPVLVGTVDEILGEGIRMDCNTIRGRSGLPWERQL